ncbi:thyrotropin-releasing hormone-degrading ectoenzyme, partial [Biomphalaria pfeifferi]
QARLDNKNINVKDVMDTWTLQMNYPVVSVSRDCTGSKNLMVHQERFLVNRNASEIGKYVSPF